jgi:phosphoglucosamine mutase
VLDCANGAAYQVAPTAIWELGAKLTSIGIEPNGKNINHKVGSTHIVTLQETVVAAGADIGIALDGDADRLIVVDEHGRVVDGDQIMALLGGAMNRSGKLTGGGIVATVMSNLGLERYLETQDLRLIRAKVGDRYVLEAMRKYGINFGGEQSGHMIMLDHATTGDGLMTGLHLVAEMARTGKTIAELATVMTALPQVLLNVKNVDHTKLASATDIHDLVIELETELGETGRILLRPSGTEPLVRVMVEAATMEHATSVATRIADLVTAQLAL